VVNHRAGVDTCQRRRYSLKKREEEKREKKMRERKKTEREKSLSRYVSKTQVFTKKKNIKKASAIFNSVKRTINN